MSLFNIRAFKAKQLTSKLAVAGLLAGGLTVAPFFAGADGGYTVPAGADVIQVVAVGGSGGGYEASATGGKGCELSASFSVTEGDTFSEVLGSNGGSGAVGNSSAFAPGGAGGAGAEGRDGGDGGDYDFLTDFRGSGGGGGGATSVYFGADEVMISAGGGGGSNVLTGGNGCASNTLNGGAGYNGQYGGGGGGTSSAGGSAGVTRGGLSGVAAVDSVGADALDADTSANGFAGGGGGGYFGGGSGASSAGCCLSAGGGAGSSWAVTPASGIKAATGKAATVGSAQVTYHAVDFPTQSLDYAEFGSTYSADLSATFKSVELSNALTALWTVSPSLPAGLTLNAATGAITGTPTEEVNNNYEFKAAWISGSDIVARSFQTINLNVGPPPPTPGAPTISTTSVTNTNVALEWTPPTRVGNSAISDYRIEYSTDGGNTWVVYEDGVSTSTSITLTNLLQLTEYEFRVTAINNDGSGPASETSSATTGLGVPGQVQLNELLAFGTDLEFSWTAPDAGGGPITDYIVEYSEDGGDTWLILNDGSGTSLSARIENLAADKNYQVRVAAVNELGTGQFSAPLEIRTRPGQDSSVTPTPTPTPTETSTPTPTPTPTSTNTPKPTPTPTKTVTPKPKPSATTTPSQTATPSATPSESATEVPTSVLDVLAEPYKHKGTIVELDPSKAIAYENGAAVEVKLIQKSTNDGYILEGGFFDLELAATSESGDPVELNEDGHLVLEKDRYATFSGSGFAPNTPVQVWLFSTPTDLKRVVTDENGNFSGSALVPAGIPVGEHTVQLNGISVDGKVRSVSLGVIVDQPATELAPAAFDWGYLVMWLVFGLLLVAVIWWLIVARRRKREDEQTA